VTTFDVSTMLTIQVTNCQMHAIGKVIRPLFADLIKNIYNHSCKAIYCFPYADRENSTLKLLILILQHIIIKCPKIMLHEYITKTSKPVGIVYIDIQYCSFY